MLETRILPYFGHFKLNKIRPIDIMQFYNLLDEDTQIVRKIKGQIKILPCLYLADPKLFKIVETNASDIGYGGILKQK